MVAVATSPQQAKDINAASWNLRHWITSNQREALQNAQQLASKRTSKTPFDGRADCIWTLLEVLDKRYTTIGVHVSQATSRLRVYHVCVAVPMNKLLNRS
jgi:hypothetical protein